ncbi:MAG: cysteine desulfurase family protein [archaeon]
MKTKAYLDYSSTTPVRKEALKAALPFFSKKFGNPSSFHSTGLEAKLAMKAAREKISKILNCAPEEIIFTGSGTESINLAIKGIALKNLIEGKKGTFITQKTEHHAVLETLEWLEKLGFKKIELGVDENGVIRLEELKSALVENKDTLLVSIMYANNEIGTIQPIEKIAQICKSHKVPFHTDACQGAEYLSLDTKKLGVDMMTLNGSKVYAFKGTGLLYKKKDLDIEPLITGGSHEFNLRAGTENVAGIVALATSLELAEKEKKKEGKRLSALRDYFISKTKKEILLVKLNGHPTERLPNNINLSFKGVEGESIMLRLNEEGIRVSTGSACTSQSLEPSHVLLALGLTHELAHGSIRFSLGKGTDKKQLDYTLGKLKKTIEFLREISPVWREKNESRRN